MGKGSVSAKFLIILNTVYSLLGAALIALSVLFYIKIENLTSLRNPSHFALETTIYWPEALPYIYACIGIFIILISCCAFLGVAKKSRAVILTHTGFQIVAVFALVAIASLTLIKADSKASDNFIEMNMHNAFHHMQDERGGEVKKGFAELEMSLQCCGVTNSTNYNHFGRTSYRYRYDLPTSCCNTEDSKDQVEKCTSEDVLAQSRPGCLQVVNLKVRTFIRIFAGAAILTAVIGLLNLTAALCLSKGLNKRKHVKKHVKQAKENGVQRKSNIVISTKELEFDNMEKAPLKV